MSTLQQLDEAWTQERRAKYDRTARVKGCGPWGFGEPRNPAGRARNVAINLSWFDFKYVMQTTPKWSASAAYIRYEREFYAK